MPLIEVSHPITEGMKTYPGLPKPRSEVIYDHESSRALYEGKAEFLIASLHLCGNTGTYVDSPRHRFRDGVDLAELPLDSVADLMVAVVDVRARADRAIPREAIRGLELRDKAVLFLTGWSGHWGREEYFGPHPFLTADACDALLDAGARFVGIDSLNIDDRDDVSRPAHTKLLGAGVPICEHMANLAAVRPDGGKLHAAPIAWSGGATFPVRAYVVA